MQIQGDTMFRFLKSYTNYVIPFYQREYSWDKKEVNQFLQDINSIDNSDYFLGSLLIKNDRLDTIIVDGQQRISTTLIFLKAVLDNTNDEKCKLEVKDLLAKTFHSKNLKDGDILKRLIDDKMLKEEDKKSRYYTNYKICYKYLKDHDADKMFDKFLKVKVAYIGVNEEIDEHKLFSQINTTGKKLTVFDLVKNFLFSKLDVNEIEDKLEILYGITNEFSDATRKDLIRHFLAYKNGLLLNKDDNLLYEGIVNMYYEYNEDASFIIDELFEFGIYYKYLFNKEYENVFEEEMRLLNKAFATYVVLIIDIFIQLSDRCDYSIVFNNEQESEIRNALLVVEAYKVRREFVGLKEKELTRFIPTIPTRVSDIPVGSYDQKLVKILLHDANEEEYGYRMPTKEEFQYSIKEKDIYSTPNFVKDFLIRLETYNTKENTDFEKFTIEHIMPQTLSSEWEQELDTLDYEVHHKFLHSIGNLTLTADNSELGNMLFKDKKNYLQENSRITLNNQLQNYDKWDYITIIDRASNIFSQCEEIWSIEDQYKTISDTYVRSDKTKLVIEENKKANNLKYLKKNKSAFNNIELTHNDIVEVLRLFLVEGYGTPRIDKEIWNIEKKGWASWAIINDLGFKMKIHKKSMTKEEFGISIVKYYDNIDIIIMYLENNG